MVLPPDSSDPPPRAAEPSIAERLLRQHRELASALSATTDVARIAELSTDAALRVPGVEAVGFYLFEPETNDLVLARAAGVSDAFLAANRRFSAGAPRVAWLREASVFHGHPPALPMLGGPDESIAREGFHALAMVPLAHLGRVLGSLNVASRSVSELPPTSRDAIETIGAIAADALGRHEAVRQVQDSHHQIRTLFETMDQGVVYQEADGSISSVNPAALRILGLTEDEIRGRTSVDARWKAVRADGSPFPGEEHPAMVALRAGTPVRGVVMGVYDPRCGELRWITVDAFPHFRDGHPRPWRVHTVFTDVTEHRRAEAALRKREARYEALVRASLDGVLLVDPEGRIVDANDAASRMLGYSPDQLLGSFIHDIDADDDREAVQARLADVRERGWARFECRHRRADGTILHVEISSWSVPEEDCVLAFVRDLTERRNAETALAEHERRYQALLNGAMDGFLVARPDGQLVEANDALERMLGYSRDDLLRMRISDFDHTYAQTGGSPPIAEIFGKGGVRFETRLTTASGGTLHAEVSAWVLPGGDAVMGFVRDLTARRRAEQELRRSEEQLRQALKMEAVGRLAGGIAHDFNNLLTVINGNATLMLDGLHPSDPLRAEIEEVRKAGERAASLTRQLLTFSRRQVVVPTVVDVDQVVRNIERMLRRLIGEDIAFEVRLGCRLPVLADQGQLEQVVVNLVVNARDAMPGGGRLVVETRTAGSGNGEAQAPPALPPGRYAVVSVSDTGHGMDDEVKQRVFEPFFTTKGQGGTGLGLPTVYGIVQQGKGHVEVSSVVGRGTRFDVYLPVTDERAGTQPPPVASVPAQRGGETVLLVEDDPGVRKMVRMILETSGYKVLSAAGGPEALAVCSGSEQPIHLVITDLVMPGMTGREFVERVRRVRPSLAVIYSSGYPDEVLTRQGLLAQGVHFLAKPYEVEGLRRRVRAVLDEAATGH